MQNKRLYNLTLFLGLFATATAQADIYKFIDESGVTHFSDSPIDERYVLVLDTPKDTIAKVQTNSNAQYKNNVSRYNNIQISPQLIAQIKQSAQNNRIEIELIHAVMYVESAYKIKAKSHKGAQGLMQLMPQTAKRFGVENSYDPAQNIEGGAKYLRELLTLFNNDIKLTLAAYNAGENAVIKYGNKIPPYKETQAYVPKVLKIYKALINQRKQAKKVL